MSFETTLMIAFALLFASYGIYLIFIWWAYRAWRNGNTLRAGIILVSVLGVGLGIPAVDQLKDRHDRTALKAAEIRSDTVDFHEKRILLISRVCGDKCKTLLRMTGSDVVRAYPTNQQFEEFVRTNQFPQGTKSVLTELGENRFSTKETPVEVPELDDFDLVIVHGEKTDWTRHFERFLPTDVSHRTTLVWRFIAKTEPSKAFAELEPVVLVMIQRDRTYQFPFHPLVKKNSKRFDFAEFDDYLRRLWRG